MKKLRKCNVIISVFFVLFYCCHSKQNEINRGQKKQIDTDQKNENFDGFRKEFYSDSLFQMSRINFPLASDLSDSLANDLKDSTVLQRTSENWKILKDNLFTYQDSIVNINGQIYKRKIVKINSQMVESVYIEDSGFFETMKFSLIKGKWYLMDYIVSDD